MVLPSSTAFRTDSEKAAEPGLWLEGFDAGGELSGFRAESDFPSASELRELQDTKTKTKAISSLFFNYVLYSLLSGFALVVAYSNNLSQTIVSNTIILNFTAMTSYILTDLVHLRESPSR